ncbi:hypothetical protein Tco_0525536 [Tanacetum coccineum]
MGVTRTDRKQLFSCKAEVAVSAAQSLALPKGNEDLIAYCGCFNQRVFGRIAIGKGISIRSKDLESLSPRKGKEKANCDVGDALRRKDTNNSHLRVRGLSYMGLSVLGTFHKQILAVSVEARKTRKPQV